ncbi:LAGLIDADG family homing endonuclease [Pseudonocardia zijingensis]|uniref:DOD-type homing endonuclease domain-containing protein n=1 Tax=Pseudonocardia zijingensis TaxID=153376 RepID=A0ABP3YLC9_9PSEU
MTAVLDRALALAADRLEGIGDRGEAARRRELADRRARLLAQCPTPLDLAARFDRRTVRTPALELIARRVVEAATSRDGRLVLSLPPQEGKALDTATPILTTAGWSTMGELQQGDEVFHPDGHPTRVLGVSAVMHDRRCYRVTTTDGRSVVADAEHLWTVRDRGRRGGGRTGRPAPWETLTTEQLLARGLLAENGRRTNGAAHRAYRFMLPAQHTIVSKPVDLPVEPYLLGAWLGDGDSTGSQLTVGARDLDEILGQVHASGARLVSVSPSHTAWRVRFSLDSRRRKTSSFRTALTALNLWGKKHIPDLYLAAGTEQRLALLQGLLDTDGSIFRTETSSRVEFTACRRVLAEGVLQLVRSLGWRATIRESAATLDGREVGRRWRVCFTPEQGGHVPFRLPRKAARMQAPQSRGGELRAVSIASIEPVESRPVRCITVDREDGLFLAGRDLVATHNSSTLRWAVLWLLANDPERRIVVASYAASLARTSGRIVRSLIESYGADLGLTVDRSHADASDWQLAGHAGGLRAVGVGGGLTGQPSDVLVVDDPLKGQAEADSATIRDNLHEWWSSVALTRLAPGAPIIVVQTRWHEDDLAGRMEAEGWPVVNIPAQADGQTPDALDRPVGEYLVSARGRTDADWAEKRKAVGERTWAALYQGRPAPLEGGVFKAAWFDTWRVQEAPAGCLPPTVVVDPADNEGDGDEAGVILATSHAETGRVYILDDLSAAMTVARWARLALLTCVRRAAPSLAYEKSLSQLPKRIREAWAQLHREAVALHRTGGDQQAAVERLARRDDSPEAREQIAAGLAEIAGDVADILAFGTAGPRLRPIVARGSKQLRMQLAAPAFETGRAVMVGRHQVVEHQATTWSPGQDSPDRVDALVHAVQLLATTGGNPGLGRATDRVPTSSTGTRNSGASRITRSTRR